MLGTGQQTIEHGQIQQIVYVPDICQTFGMTQGESAKTGDLN